MRIQSTPLLLTLGLTCSLAISCSSDEGIDDGTDDGEPPQKKAKTDKED